MAWLEQNWPMVALAAAVVVAVLNHLGKAKAAGVLEAVIKGVESSRSSGVKAQIRARAEEAGVEKALNSIVKKITAGALLGFLSLGLVACAAPEAGRATSPVDARLTIEWPRVKVADGAFPGPVTVTATQTITVTPTSTAEQTATTTTDAKAEVPGGVLGK